MYLDNIFNEIKNKLMDELKDLTLDDFPRYKDLSDSHYKIIEQLIELKKIDSSYDKPAPLISEVESNITLKADDCITIKSESITVTESKQLSPTLERKYEEEAIMPDPPIKAEDDSSLVNTEIGTVKKDIEEKKDDNYPIGHTFAFEKKAYGGILKEIDCLIHEDMVRELSLENGYKMKIIGHVDVIQKGKPKYEFEVVDETPFPREDLIEVKHGIVERVAGRLVVSNTASGPVKIDEMSATLFIGYKDTTRLRIRVGDIVDGRFYRNNVQSFRVSNKHEIEAEDTTTSIETKKLQHRQNNQVDTEREKGLSMLERLDKKPFRNKKIVLVGLRSRMNDFRSLLDQTNEIDMIHLDGYEHKTRIRSRVLKADYVMISTVENGHKVTPYVAALCNEFDISFTSTSADGFTGILHDLKKLIDQTEAKAM